MSFYRMQYYFVPLFLSMGVNALASTSTKEFPGRAIYPSVAIIDIQALFASLDRVTVVDVRSSYEYNTLRIKGAINIPLSSPRFVAEMRKLRSKTEAAIVVYCNGKTCMKSYKAAVKSAKNNISEVISYDAGVMDWAKRYPKHAVLLGKSPIDPSRLISKKDFQKHLLTPDDYGDYMASSSALVLDVRDRFQREGISIFVGRERRAYLDDKSSLNKYIAKAKQENRTLLIHDAAGKQVRWLQYYLKEKGVKRYYFMKGGVSAYYNEMKQDFN
ncbi:MAG: rhodanese-like domain-containing protein [Thiohalomonadales bacterium]